jgi:hypothetical protein
VSSPIASAYTPPFLIIHSISYNNMVALDSAVDYEYKKHPDKPLQIVITLADKK